MVRVPAQLPAPPFKYPQTEENTACSRDGFVGSRGFIKLAIHPCKQRLLNPVFHFDAFAPPSALFNQIRGERLRILLVRSSVVLPST